MIQKALTLEVVTPERLLVHEEVESVELPGRNGYLGILPGHAPLITELGYGFVKFRKGTEVDYLCVFGGFAEVLGNRVILLAETGERAEEVDVDRARAALDRARQRMADTKDLGIDHERAARAFDRATIRLQVAGLGGAPLATEVEHHHVA